MRSASRSASSRYCVVRKTVVPASASERMTSHSSRRLRVSRPVVGSSRKRIAGVDDEAEREVEASAHAAGVGADASARGIRQIEALEQLGGAGPRRGRPSPDSRPSITRFSVPVSTSSTAADWPVRLMRCLHLLGRRGDVEARRRSRAAGVGAHEGREDVDGGGLAGAVRARAGRRPRRRATVRSRPASTSVDRSDLRRPRTSMARCMTAPFDSVLRRRNCL